MLGDEGSSGQKCIAIIHVPFTPLADQWIDELSNFNLSAIKCYGSSKKWSDKLDYELAKFKQAESPFVLPLVVIDKTFFMETFQEYLTKIEKSNLFYICDECHRFAKKGKTEKAASQELRDNFNMQVESIVNLDTLISFVKNDSDHSQYLDGLHKYRDTWGA